MWFHKDIPVRGFVQPVDHTAGETVIEGDQSAPVGTDVDMIQAGHAGEIARPASCGVHHETAGDDGALSGARVRRFNPHDMPAFAHDAPNLRIGTEGRAVPAGGKHVLPDQAKAVHGSVRHTIGGQNVGGKVGFDLQRLFHWNRLGFNAAPRARVNPAFLKGRIRFAIFRSEHEQPFGIFDAVPADGAQDAVFRNAFFGGFGIGNRIARSAVQQTVKARTRAVGQITLFQKKGLESSHGKVAQHARTGGPAADDDNIPFLSRIFGYIPHRQIPCIMPASF